MTPQGAQKLRDELVRLKEERPKISRDIGIAREHGDLSENAEYHAAKDRQGMVEARIKDIEDKLCRAEVIDPSTLSGDRVRFGASGDSPTSTPTRKSTYRIVGADEADIDQGYDLGLVAARTRLIGQGGRRRSQVALPAGQAPLRDRERRFQVSLP